MPRNSVSSIASVKYSQPYPASVSGLHSIANTATKLPASAQNA